MFDALTEAKKSERNPPRQAERFILVKKTKGWSENKQRDIALFNAWLIDSYSAFFRPGRNRQTNVRNFEQCRSLKSRHSGRHAHVTVASGMCANS